MTQDSSVKELPGIGEARAAAFARLGIFTLRDLLYHFPRAFESRKDIRPLCTIRDAEVATTLLTVATAPKNAIVKRTMTLTKFRAFDDSGSVEITFFNQPFLKDSFKVGETYRFHGKFSVKRNALLLSSPSFELYREDAPLPEVLPLYPLCDGISRKILQNAIFAAFHALLPTLSDPLPESLRLKAGFPTLSVALRGIHAPKSTDELRESLRRLAFDEIFSFMLGHALAKGNHSTEKGIPCKPADPAPLLSQLPYQLTDAQLRVCREIYNDMRGGSTPPMSRILIGDVGCGKTVCAALAVYNALANGGQAAIMAPTEILARQHAESLAPMFEALGYRVALLLGSTRAAEKKKIYEAVSRGEISLLIGTHALLNENLQFSNLILTVADEQHRFGVKQRTVLREKNPRAHLLVMSATPIPRTLALALYGDLSISRIDEMPKGRQRVDTFVVDESYRARLNGFIRKQVEDGGQVYIVCPAIEADGEEISETELDLSTMTLRNASSLPDLKTVSDYTKKLQNEVFPDLSIGFLHGKMKPSEKDETMRRFAEGELSVLISTTVIEVGVNVPNATLMIVENADRFGLSQLHQLRGRVGRGTRKSYCVLVSENRGQNASSRLSTMKSTYDGYQIAEADLALRGPGDFFASNDGSVRQSGGFSFRLTGLYSDQSLLALASEFASELIASDPALSKEENAPLRNFVLRAFDINEKTFS